MALYHIHRPQTFADVIGQNHILQTLINQIKQDKVAHAYLFSGPRGVGKTTLARLLAKAVNCPREKNSAEPDNSSECSIEISQGRSIDVIEIDAASHTGVDNVRQNIIENAQFKPTKLKYKVFIIDEVHMLSTAAFNALLKTLEEPPEHVLFILATTEIHKLPVTIVSRCQRFNFKKVSNQEIQTHLEKIAKSESVEVENEIIKRIARKSEGCVRDAISLLDQIISSGEKKITAKSVEFILPTTNIEDQLDFLNFLAEKNAQQALSKIGSLIENGVRIEEYMNEIIEIMRSMMIFQIDKSLIESELDLDQKNTEELAKISNKLSPSDLVKLTDLFIKRKKEVKSNPIEQFPLEMLVIEWCGLGEEQTEPETVEKKEIKEEVHEKIQEEVVPKKSITSTVKKILKKSDISLEKIQEKWPAIISEIEKEFPTLVFILKMVELKEVDGNTLVMSAQYSFHQEKLSEAKCKDNLESIISNLCESKIRINVIVSDQSTQNTQNNELTELVSAFGGEIIH